MQHQTLVERRSLIGENNEHNAIEESTIELNFKKYQATVKKQKKKRQS